MAVSSWLMAHGSWKNDKPFIIFPASAINYAPSFFLFP
jgi:hypothetical protein